MSIMENASRAESNHSKPSLFWLVTEAGRAISELGMSVPYRSLIKHESIGDGHPVIILPGFMATGKSTSPLRKFINKIGYEAHDWGLGRNIGKEEFYYNMLDRLEEIYSNYHQKISLVGWSLGGLYARQLAKEKPHLVRQIITLGSPFGNIKSPNHAHWMYQLVSGMNIQDVDIMFLEDLPNPAPVPTTAIFTKEDGVVNWKLCKEEIETKIHQNIQVRGSHLGLGVNPSVLRIIADRLQYAEENWRHF